LPAALLMSSVQAALSPLVQQNLSPQEICQRLNGTFCELMPLGKFISLFYAVLNTKENRLAYCNAGHNPPLMVRADGSSSELNSGGAVLGQFPEWSYEQRDLRLEKGDRLLIFTDGLVEACNSQDEPFGEENALRIARENSGAPADQFMKTLIAAASEHCGGKFQDDASLIVVKVG
jgi:sigma-B regulation protein RsbU (phosphoserine phosphatase)